MQQFVLALDQGTTSSRAILFDEQGRAVSQAQREHRQILPWPGHVEHDAEEIWTAQRDVAQAALAQARVPASQVAAIGITNQRETVVVWERASGRPVANAIVWQSRVSSPICERLKASGAEQLIQQKTGLLLDPYFTATKLCWLFEQRPELRVAAERGDVICGTIDSFLVWRLTNGRLHVTDVSNASRTLLFNLHTLDWDDELLGIFNLPRAMLPQVVPSSGVFAETTPEHLGAAIPIGGIAGDQQAAAFGQACFSPGMAKNTYGTGCFLLCNTGERPAVSQQRLLSTVGWQIDGRTTYFLEGAVFVAGAAVQWLRDGLGLIQSSSEVESLAAQVPDTDGVFFVPALTGLGAPYWDPYARGTIVGLTRGATKAHLARATLEAMAYQTCDLLTAMNADAEQPLTELRVDGGASVNNLLLQFQADLLGVPVSRPRCAETTALGAAYLAGLATGFWPSQKAIVQLWHEDRRFTPQMPPVARDKLLRGWKRAVERALHWDSPRDATTAENCDNLKPPNST